MSKASVLSAGSVSPAPAFRAALVPLLRNPIWIIALILTVFFASLSSHFLTAFNISNIVFQASLVGFLAIGLTPVVIGGDIDLTIGAVVALSACLAIALQPYGLPLAIGGAMLAGLSLGTLNGVLVERLGVSSFIVTLAGMIGIRGLAFLFIGDTSLPSTDDRFGTLVDSQFGLASSITIVFLLCVVGFRWVLRNTQHGRNTYAIGGNRTAAIDAGIPVSRHVIINFAASGLMAALCGIAMAAHLSAATPSYGTDYELWAVISVVLGGTRLRGGVGGVIGTLIAVLTLAVLQNGLNLIQISPFYIPVIMGFALIAALLVDRQFNRRAGE
jgi:ribose transport system permease protein